MRVAAREQREKAETVGLELAVVRWRLILVWQVVRTTNLEINAIFPRIWMHKEVRSG